MGCHCSTKAQFSGDFQSEDDIMMHETSLGYSELSAHAISSTVKAFSSRGMLLQKRFVDVLIALDLPHGQLQYRDGPLFMFYKLLTEKKVFTIRKLTILGVMLGTGSHSKKASLLYSVYENRKNRTLTQDDLRLLVNSAFDLAFVYIPKYAELGMAHFNDLERLKKLEKYMLKLSRRRKLVQDRVFNAIYSGKAELKEKEFVGNVCEKCAYFLNSHGLRWYTANLDPETFGEEGPITTTDLTAQSVNEAAEEPEAGEEASGEELETSVVISSSAKPSEFEEGSPQDDEEQQSEEFEEESPPSEPTP